MTDAAWLVPTFAAELTPPRLNDKLRRSPNELLAVVGQFEVATAERYRKRDVTGDKKDETFCNRFAVDVLRAMGTPVPLQLANLMHAWFLTHGEAQGWCKVNAVVGRALAVDLGWPVVAIWRNLTGGHGHIAVVVPHTAGPPSPTRTYVAQAGVTNSACMPLETAFGTRKPLFFAHE